MLPEWKLRLKTETQENAKRLNDLNAFMKTEKFYELPRKEKDLLYEQQRAMSTYLQILGKRCEIYGIKIDIEEVK